MYGAKKGGVAKAPVKDPVSGAKSASGKNAMVIDPTVGKTAGPGGKKAK